MSATLIATTAAYERWKAKELDAVLVVAEITLASESMVMVAVFSFVTKSFPLRGVLGDASGTSALVALTGRPRTMVFCGAVSYLGIPPQ
jgi:hypothetical protein